jgi:hypothetical protein
VTARPAGERSDHTVGLEKRGVVPPCPVCGPGTITIRLAVPKLCPVADATGQSFPLRPPNTRSGSIVPATAENHAPRPVAQASEASRTARKGLTCRRTERLAWWCSLAGALLGAGACTAILAGNLAHAAAGVAPVLAWAPLNIMLVAMAFGLAAIVAEGVPRLVDSAPPLAVSNRAGHAIATASPVIARCAACGSVFADGFLRRSTGQTSAVHPASLVPSAN